MYRPSDTTLACTDVKVTSPFLSYNYRRHTCIFFDNPILLYVVFLL